MGIDLGNPAVLVALGTAFTAFTGGIATIGVMIIRVIRETGNHKATANAEMLAAKIDTQTQVIINKYDEGTNKIVSAILSQK
jgi:hypothetical protein